MRTLPAILIALLAVRCGVEAGNAGNGGKGKTQVQVVVAQQESSGDESLSLSLSSISLVTEDGTESTALTPSVQDIDLFSSSESTVVAESSGVAAGTYAKVTVKLGGDKPVRYRDARGQSHDVGFEDDNRSFYIAQTIQITEGETNRIVLNLDPYSSVSRNQEDQPYIFKPRGDAMREARDLKYSGQTAFAGAAWACAYAYDLPPFMGRLTEGDFGPGEGHPPRGGDGGRGPEEGRGDGPGHGREAEGRPSFGSSGDIQKDTNAGCSQAFARTPVKNGRYEFRHLIPGTYAIRIFNEQDQYEDLSPDVILKEKDHQGD